MGAQRQRRWTSQLKKRENPPSSLLSFCLGPQQIKWCLPTLLRMVFTQATASNANISESFTEALRNHVLPGVWASLSPVRLIHKINHLRIQKVLKSYRNQIPHGSLWFSLLSLFCVLGWKLRLLIWCVCVCVCVCVRAQSCLTLCDPRDCYPPGSSVHGIFQARILGWVDISSSRGSSWPRDWVHLSCVSCIGTKILHDCAIWEALELIFF